MQIKELNEDNLKNFNTKRKIGEHGSEICELIRADNVVDFITYIEKRNISSKTLIIDNSIYETNLFLSKKDKSFSLIEYSAFFGSQQIFRYLYQNGSKLTSSIWPYIIHGNNPDMIHLLEENNVKTFDDSYQYLIVEAIKCHNNDFAVYLQDKCSEEEKIYDQFLLKKHLKHYNFKLVKMWDSKQLIELASSNDLFYFLCKYDYSTIVEFLSTLPKIDINNQFKIYHAPSNQKDAVQRTMAKNGDVDHLMNKKSSKYHYFEEMKKSEYKEERFFIMHTHDLEVTSGLHCALQKGNLDTVSVLINSKNINVDAKSRKYYKTLKRHNPYGGDDEYYTNKKVKSLLHEAIISGYVDVVSLLVSLKNVDIKELFEFNREFSEAFCTSHNYLCDKVRKTPLLLATEYGYIEIMKFLLSQKNVDINETSETVKYRAGGCEVYTKSATKEMITPLSAALKKGNFIAIKFFLSQPTIDVNIDFTEIKINMKKFYDEIVDIFKVQKGRIKNKITTLCLSVMSNDIDIVKLLLNVPNVDVNKVSVIDSEKYRETAMIRAPLHLAVDEKNIEIIQLLLQQKDIDTNIIDENEKKPIDHTDDEKIRNLFKSA